LQKGRHKRGEFTQGLKKLYKKRSPFTLRKAEMEIDREWVKVAKRRLAELRSGAVKPIPGNDVPAKIR
jgi:hypothetical protein